MESGEEWRIVRKHTFEILETLEEETTSDKDYRVRLP